MYPRNADTPEFNDFLGDSDDVFLSFDQFLLATTVHSFLHYAEGD
jgi:hypothetical protein